MNMTLQPDPFPLRAAPDGNIYVGSSRILLDDIVTWFKQGMPADQIAQGYPTITPADVYAVIAHYLRHQDEIDAYLVERQIQCDELRHRIEAAQPEQDERRVRIEAARVQRDAHRVTSANG